MRPAKRPLAIPLAQAFFCESCQVVIDSPHCCCCDSYTHTYRMANWLNRDESVLRLPSSAAHFSTIPTRQRA